MVGIVAEIEHLGSPQTYKATLRAGDTGQVLAIVEGSWPWVRRGLRATGLFAPPVSWLPKDGDGRLTLVSGEPPRRLSEGSR